MSEEIKEILSYMVGDNPSIPIDDDILRLSKLSFDERVDLLYANEIHELGRDVTRRERRSIMNKIKTGLKKGKYDNIFNPVVAQKIANRRRKFAFELLNG